VLKTNHASNALAALLYRAAVVLEAIGKHTGEATPGLQTSTTANAANRFERNTPRPKS
jgi:hypothetical protein